MAAGPWVVEVTEENFDREVLQRSRELPVVVDFWSPSCQPCRVLGPMLEALAEECKGEVLLAKVNVDYAQNLAMQFGIEALPTVHVLRDGRVVNGFVGLLPQGQLREFVRGLCPTEADKLVTQARGLEANDAAAAEALYQRALAVQPDHGGAILGRVRLHLAAGKDQEAEALLGTARLTEATAEEAQRLEHLFALRKLGAECGAEAEARQRVEAEPNNAEHRYALGCVLGRLGRYPEALAMLLSAGERSGKLAQGKVREAMVAIFRVVGERDPLADEYRKKLTQILY